MEPPNPVLQDALRPRLRRIEGQIQGIQRMLNTDRPCEEVLTQLLAVRAATEKACLLVAEQHVTDCALEPSLASDDPRRQAIREAMTWWVRAGA